MKRKLKSRYKSAITIFLDGEIPSLGSGMRRVIIRSRGRKWVSLIHPSAKAGCRIKRSIFDQIERATERRMAR